MEALRQSYGFVLYRTRLVSKTSNFGRLEIKGLHDYGLVIQDSKILGTIDRRLNQTGLDVDISNSSTLDILVEYMGRICYGRGISEDKKGITEGVTFNGRELTGWEIFLLPLTDLSPLVFGRNKTPAPSFFRGYFELASVGDTFLLMHGWGKGCVWVNRSNLGRYWHIGPQQSLFLPSPWLKKGKTK
jgi:beta-galactosidase